MKQTLSIVVFFLLLLLSACATPTPDPATPASEPTLIHLPALTVHPSATIAPSAEPTNTPKPAPAPSLTPEAPNGSPTPGVPIAQSPDGREVQCYFGPGIEYAPAFAFKAAEIVGKDRTGSWWYVQAYDNLANPIYCWVNTQNTRTAGRLSDILITEAERGSVTALNISSVGNGAQEIACGQNPALPEFHFVGEIKTNGPVDKLRYQWLTDAGMKFSPEQITVQAWDTPAHIQISVTTPAREGTYSLTLRTILPNEMVQIAQFTVKCR